MYLPPLDPDDNDTATRPRQWSTWDYRKDLLRKRIALVDADVVCFQEVAPVSFDDDFAFMKELGYQGEMFRKGRFRPATFFKPSRLERVSPEVHKDRALLSSFRRATANQDGQTPKSEKNTDETSSPTWYVLNCHLQAGKEGRRRVRQINEGVRAAMTLARKHKLRNPERHIPLIVCGDFNGGPECGAVRYLEDGGVDETFREDGEPVVSSRKDLPLEHPMVDVMAFVTDRDPPATLVVNELISIMVKGQAYENPTLSEEMVTRLSRIYDKLASEESGDTKVMGIGDVEAWLVAINGELGRGSEFRNAAKKMGWKDGGNEKERITLPSGGRLSKQSFIEVYEDELKGGKFWGIAHDMAVLGEPLEDAGVFQARFDRIYCSSILKPTAVMDFTSSVPCPNGDEPSDHLPVAASFSIT